MKTLCSAALLKILTIAPRGKPRGCCRVTRKYILGRYGDQPRRMGDSPAPRPRLASSVSSAEERAGRKSRNDNRATGRPEGNSHQGVPWTGQDAGRKDGRRGGKDLRINVRLLSWTERSRRKCSRSIALTRGTRRQPGRTSR